jgi:hypothetical protein
MRRNESRLFASPRYGGILTFERPVQPHSSENRNAAQTCRIRSGLRWARRRSNRWTVTALWRLIAHGAFIPSSTSSTTSDGTPRIAEVMGATVTIDRRWMEISRVRITTGRCLSGRSKRHRNTSPRLHLPAMPLSHPNPSSLRLPNPASLDTRGVLALRVRVCALAPGARRELYG